LDSYLDALQHFPKNADYLKVTAGEPRLIKTDIFKGLMWYQFKGEPKQYELTIERVKEILKANKNGEIPETLMPEQLEEEINIIREDSFEDGSGMLTIETLERTTRRNKRKQRKKRKRGQPQQKPGNNTNNKSNQSANKKTANRSNNRSNKSKTNSNKKQNQQKNQPSNNAKKKSTQSRNNKSKRNSNPGNKNKQ